MKVKCKQGRRCAVWTRLPPYEFRVKHYICPCSRKESLNIVTSVLPLPLLVFSASILLFDYSTLIPLSGVRYRDNHISQQSWTIGNSSITIISFLVTPSMSLSAPPPTVTMPPI